MTRHPWTTAVLVVATLLLVLFSAVWLARFRIATAIVNSKLSAANVPASYQITRIGPFLERMENVRLGDPAAPDLVARRIDVALGYGFSGPFVRRITVEGVRLRGRYEAGALHFGTLDRLLPKSGGKTALPDIALSIGNAELVLGTAAGTLSLTVAGEGNPARRFGGDARLVALSLKAGGCVAQDVAAVLKIGSNAGKPYASGPLRVSGLACPEQQVALGQGAAQIAVASDASFQRITLDANLAGFGGRIQGARFAAVSGSIAGSRSPRGFGAAAKLGLKSASVPSLAQYVGGLADSAAGTPLGPVAEQAIDGLSHLLRDSDAVADLNVVADTGQPLEVRLHRITLTNDRGAKLEAIGRGGLAWTRTGLRADADLHASGGGLPVLDIQLRQAAAGRPVVGIATISPYRTGNAQLASSPLRFTWDGREAEFAATVTIHGPIGDGFVHGLTVPVRGHATSTGAIEMNRGCHPMAFQQLRLASFTFDAAHLAICGDPIVARGADGAWRVTARSGAARLTARTADGAPVVVGAARLAIGQAGFAAEKLTATLGNAVQPTHLAIAALSGSARNGRIGGRFTDASGAIGNVPLQLANANGEWVFAGNALRLTGKLRVSDATAPAVRFNPLATENALLGLEGGTITASAILREPASRNEVTRVSLAHHLSSGTGHALLDVPGITFDPNGLQPETLTPLTLGVIANVAGTISGQGRIDWNAKGVTSSGDFSTDGIDLAAAFGPVTGLKGRIHFTDLLGLTTAPGQEATVAEINPGVTVTNGVVHYQVIGRGVRVEDANWPLAGGNLSLDPTTLNFGGEAERYLTFRVKGMDAAAFVQQLDFPNISATGTFDGLLPMIFDQRGGRIEGGKIVARGGGNLAYIGEVSNAQLGTMGKLVFDALKAIRYSALDVTLDGRLDGEMVSVVRFTGVREATPDHSLITRLIRNLPFRFNIAIHAPFRALIGSARSYINPELLLKPPPPAATPSPAAAPIQPSDIGVAR